MGWSSDPDLVSYGIYSDIAWDEWLGNPRLLEIAQGRYDEVSGWQFGTPFAYVPTIGLDYLMEATLTHAFGFFRSSIFCCAAALDIELKRSLQECMPDKARVVERQTFGQSIRYARNRRPPQSTLQRLSTLAEINGVRNKAAVHPSRPAALTPFEEDETTSPWAGDDLQHLFRSEEIASIEENAKKDGTLVNWLEKLSYRTIWQTKMFIAGGPLDLSGASSS